MNKTGLGTEINSAMALRPFSSNFGCDKIQTQDPPIVSLVCYPLDQTFAFVYKKKSLTINFELACKELEILKKVSRSQVQIRNAAYVDHSHTVSQ